MAYPEFDGYNKGFKGFKTFKGLQKSSSGEQDPEQQLATLTLLAKSQGVDAGDAEPKEGVLQKLSRVLNIGRAATAGIQEYGDPIRGIVENLDSAEIMKRKLGRELTTGEKALAFGEDVILDPLTYLTFGVGAGVKIGGKVITKAGTKLIKQAGEQAVKGIAEKSARELARKEAIELATTNFAQGVKAGDPEYLKYLDKGGIKFAGKTVVSGEKTGRFASNISKAIEKKAPGVSKVLQATGDELGKTFVPSYEIKQQVKQLRAVGKDALADKLEGFIKGKKALSIKNTQSTDEAIAMFEQEAKALKPEVRAQVTNVLDRAPTEAGVQTPTSEIDTLYKEGRAAQEAAQKEAGRAQEIADSVGKIDNIKGITQRRVDQLKALGIKTVDDLIAINEKELGRRFKTTFGREVGTLPRELKTAAGDTAEQFVDSTYKAQDLGVRANQIADETRASVEAARGSLDNVSDPLVRDASIKIRDMYDADYKGLNERGILDAGIEDYAARNLTPEAQAKITDQEGLGFAKGQLSTSIGSAGKHRTNQLTIAESEELIKRKYGITGDVYQKDALINAANYHAKAQKSINNFDFHKQVMDNFGEQAPELVRTVRDKSGKPKKIKEWGNFTGADGVEMTVPKVKWYQQTGTAVPKSISKDLEATQQFLTNEESLGDFIKVVDKIQNYWKTGVTGFFPSFHVRNMFGGGYNNWLAGVNDVKVYQDAGSLLKQSGIMEKTLDPKKIEQARQALSKIKFTDALGKESSGEEILKAYDEFVGRGTGKVADMKGLTTTYATDKQSQALKWIENKTRGTTEKVEEHIRLPLFIDTWKKTGNFQEAADKVFKYHFDYSQVGGTNFENAVLKKVFPFYTWTRNNIPLQIETILKQPGKQSATLKLFNNLIDPEVQAQLPSYLQQGLGIQTGPTVDGNAPILTGLGLPIEDLNNISTRGVMGMLSPLVKTPAELALNKSTFYDKPVSELGPQFAKYYKDAPKSIRDFLEVKEITDKNGKKTYTGNPQKLFVMQSVAGRLTSSLYKAGDETLPGGQRALNSVTGVNIRSVNLENERYYRSRALLDEYQKRLKEKGVLKSHTNYYQPKGTTVAEIK